MRIAVTEAPRPRRRGAIELATVLAGYSALTAALTFPLAFHLGSLGYKPNVLGDAQYSIWNIGWVAHALLTDPLHVLDANIFFPHKSALIYSEANLLTGALAAPVYAITGNPFAAHNFVVLLSFVLSATGMYYLVRHLTGDRGAAAVSGVLFAYSSYAFGHLLHIQLLMTAGIPFSLLAFHRLQERRGAGRGAVLGVVMGLQGLACAYYAVFVALLIGFAVMYAAIESGVWRSAAFWSSVAVAAAVSAAIVFPLFWRYLELQQDTGFTRGLNESGSFAATWSSYLTGSSYTWSPIYPLLRDTFNWAYYREQLFPGVFATIFGIGGALLGIMQGGRTRRFAVLYALIAALAFWESFGPAGGLYSLTYSLPGFSFLRAPSRFGVLVVFGLAVLAAFPVSALLRRSGAPALVTGMLLVAGVFDLATPVPLTPIEPIHAAYYHLRPMPPGGLLEMPPRSHKYSFMRTQYMVNSMAHWKPIVNAYSDFIPSTLYNSLDVLAQFPDESSFELLRRDGVRYVTFDLREYDKDPAMRRALDSSIAAYAQYLKPIYADRQILLFEIAGYPQPR